MYRKTCIDLSLNSITWGELAAVDAQLVEQYVNSPAIIGHSIPVQHSAEGKDVEKVLQFLSGEYRSFLETCKFDVVDYLPHLNCTPLGVFAKTILQKGTVVQGLTGYLSELKPEEIQVGINDFSLINSNLKNKQWLMLGPISFVNHSCLPNVKYEREKLIMTCVTLRDICPGDEIVVTYGRHYFGNFNQHCCCKHKKYHTDPCPSSPEKRKKRKLKTSNSLPLRCNRKIYKPDCQKLSFDELSTRFSTADRGYQDSSDENEQFDVSFVEYDSLYSNSTTSSSGLSLAANLDNPTCDGDSSTQFKSDSPENSLHEPESLSSPPLDPDQQLQPLMSSTPLNLSFFDEQQEFERVIAEDTIEDDVNISSAELYHGSDFSVTNFFESFDLITSRHKLSDCSRKDILKLLSLTLPSPNNLLCSAPSYLLPTIVRTDFESSTILTIDICQQLKNVLARNKEHIKCSWLKTCSWATPQDNYTSGEIQIVINLDGASVFKSRNTSIWPLWVQIHNLPPKIRNCVSNMSLLALWHGNGKPNFRIFLSKIVTEILLAQKCDLLIEGLGNLKVKVKNLVADMPATAYALCMYQHNGFFSCCFCTMRGVRHNNRTLFPVKATFEMRTSESFLRCSQTAERLNVPVLGIKTNSPFNSILNLPWDAPIDPMHQIFLGTAKVLCKMLISIISKHEMETVQKRLSACLIPFDFLHRLKRFDEIAFWKATDFKLFFFHVGPLIFSARVFSEKNLDKLISFRRLSIAIRLLTKPTVDEKDLNASKQLIEKFFSNFVKIFGVDSQSFNFHTMRHLVDQVRRIGPLWLFSAFAFESAHRELLTSACGTVKFPQKLVERFLLRQEIRLSRGQTKDYFSKKFDRKPECRSFTSVSKDCHDFLPHIKAENFCGRYISFSGQTFCSSAYTKIGKNFSECIVRTSENFVLVECFYVGQNGLFFALVRQFEEANEIDISLEENSCNLIFEIERCGELLCLPAEKLLYKCVVLPQNVNNKKFKVSIMQEGFEHN